MGNLFSSSGGRVAHNGLQHQHYSVVHQPQSPKLEIQKIQEREQEDERQRQYRLKLEEQRRGIILADQNWRLRIEQEEQAQPTREDEYSLDLPSLWDSTPSLRNLTPQVPHTPLQQGRSGGTYIDDWEDWEEQAGADLSVPSYPTRQIHPAADYSEDVDLGKWRKVRASNRKKGVLEARRVRGRKAKGDLYESDYHAGHTKDEILAMCRERQANFEVQAMKRGSR